MRLSSRLYVRIHRDSLLVRNADTGAFLKEPPLVAVSVGEKRKVMAIGYEAAGLRGRADVEVVAPFAHPRTPLSDYVAAEFLVKAFVKKLTGGGLFLSPVIVMHLAGELEGGVTQIEGRALLELGMGAGASRSYGWVGPDLTDEQVRELDFPSTGKLVE